MRSLTNEQLAFWAGIIEGEGCITIKRQKRSNRRPTGAYKFLVEVTNTDQEMLLDLASEFGIGTVTERISPRTPNESRSWCYRVIDRKAARFLESILPFLRYKKDEAELGLRFHRIFRSGRVGYPCDREFCHQCYLEMRALKKKHKNRILSEWNWPQSSSQSMPLFPPMDHYPEEFQPKMAPGFPLSLSHMCTPLPVGYD